MKTSGAEYRKPQKINSRLAQRELVRAEQRGERVVVYPPNKPDNSSREKSLGQTYYRCDVITVPLRMSEGRAHSGHKLTGYLEPRKKYRAEHKGERAALYHQTNQPSRAKEYSRAEQRGE